MFMVNIVDEATKILKKPIGWVELDLDFDLLEWGEEASIINQYLVEHREGETHKGWESCCIHGIDVHKTGHWNQYTDNENNISYKWTSIAPLVPSITSFWKSFPTEKFARLRFMKLSPGGWITPHNDAPNGLKNTDFNMMDHMIPINIAITHPDNCEMILDTYGKVPWKPGKAFIINITDTHRVNNNSTLPRMHMIAHCIIGNQKEEFSELLVRSYKKNHDNKL